MVFWCTCFTKSETDELNRDMMKIFQDFEDVFNLGPFSQDIALLTTFSFGLEGRGCVSSFHLAFPIVTALTSQIRERIGVSSSCQIYQIQLCTQGLSKWPWWVCGHIRSTARQVGPGIHLSFGFHLTPPHPACPSERGHEGAVSPLVSVPFQCWIQES